MHFTNIFIGLVSLTNVTLFVNRLINDGQFQTAILLYNNEAIRDTNFIRELTDCPNRNYSIVTVCVDEFESSDWAPEFSPYSKIVNALHLIMVNEWSSVTLADRQLDFSHNRVFLLPMQRDDKKKQVLQKWKDRKDMFRGNHSAVFYQTPHTIQQAVSKKSIEVFVMNSQLSGPNRCVFEIDGRSDINSQLSQTRNVYEKIFARKEALIVLTGQLGKINISAISKSVIATNADIFMANYIARNLKNLTAWQFLEIKNGVKGLIKYRPSEESIYGDLFLSSLEAYKAAKYVDM